MFRERRSGGGGGGGGGGWFREKERERSVDILYACCIEGEADEAFKRVRRDRRSFRGRECAHVLQSSAPTPSLVTSLSLTLFVVKSN